jgi:RNA-binding protein
MDYTGKQKAKLRKLANAKPVMFQVGIAGLSDVVIKNILDYLKKHEVGRISILKGCKEEISDIIAKLGDNNIYVTARIGRVLLLYKANPELKDRIVL